MKERIIQLFGTDNLNVIAHKTGVKAQTLGHIWSGRNHPSVGVIQKIHETIPNVSLSWLMFGEGDMYITQKCETLAKLGDIEPASQQIDKNSTLKEIASDIHRRLYLQSEKNFAVIELLEELKEQNAKILKAMEELTPYL